jgi:hypothetical protein
VIVLVSVTVVGCDGSTSVVVRKTVDQCVEVITVGGCRGVSRTVVTWVIVLVTIAVDGCDGNTSVVVAYTVVQCVEVITAGGCREVSRTVVR